MNNTNIVYMNYNPKNHPCRDCTERNAYCHGTCERYKEFEANRPRTPRNLYNARGRMRDPFHKKGRVIRRGT